MDAVSQKLYYYNSQTGETTWMRPTLPASWQRQAPRASLIAASGVGAAIASAAPLLGLSGATAGRLQQQQQQQLVAATAPSSSGLFTTTRTGASVIGIGKLGRRAHRARAHWTPVREMPVGLSRVTPQ